MAGFATVGVTWAHGTTIDEAAIKVSVRTQSNGVWTAWEQMEYHDDHGPDPGSAELAKRGPAPRRSSWVTSTTYR